MALNPPTMDRLAFVRLLHQQAAEQSRLPPPMNFMCVLMYHDAVELFLLLAGEHLGANIPEKGNFTQRYFDNINRELNGTELSGRKGVGRLTDQRNAFKHANTWPGPTGIEQFRADAAAFFEDNTPKVFGVEFAKIEMADVVPQEGTRQKLKEAAEAEAEGDRTQAMGYLVIAFDDLFQEHVGPAHAIQSEFSFGRTIRTPAFRGIGGMVNQLQTSPSDKGHARAADRFAKDRIGQALDLTVEAVISLQKAMRVMAIGIDYYRYVQFDRLTPEVRRYSAEHVVFDPEASYAPSVEEFQFCQSFVIEAALRLAEISAVVVRPSWRPEVELGEVEFRWH
ncbi:hypothetical protein [Actinoallomurus acaciae]|uniref:HEPN AbiU2-like domain-containing protein n=1 Tax=Actinoallomurus acaciae TaxID=502577 RepID=A0ABV5Y7Z8_9ACTN